MKKPISEYTDPQALKNLMHNAKRASREDIWQEAFRRLCSLEGIGQSEPIARDFHTTLRAYEELLTEKNGRTTKASRTRQKLKNKGLIQCLEDWAVSDAPTQGFDLLVGKGLAELTGEYLVLKHPDKFSSKAIDAARKRLEQFGITPPTPS